MGLLAAIAAIVGILAVAVGWFNGGHTALQRWRGIRPIELGLPRPPLDRASPDYGGLDRDEADRGRYATVYAYNNSDYAEQFAVDGAKSTLRSPSGRICDRRVKLDPRSGGNFHVTVVVDDPDWDGAEVGVRLVGQTDGKAKVRWRGTVPVVPYYSVPLVARF